jgi:hypothetical protein
VYVVAVPADDGTVSPEARQAALDYTEALRACNRLSEGAVILTKVMRVCLPGIG